MDTSFQIQSVPTTNLYVDFLGLPPGVSALTAEDGTFLTAEDGTFLTSE